MRRPVLIAIVAALLAGCGDEERPVSPVEDALTDAVAATSAEESASLTVSGTIEVAGETGTYDGEGVIRFRPPAAGITLSVQIAGEEVEVESRQIGAVSYIRTGEAAPLPGGKEWLKLDLGAALGPEAGNALSSGTNPTQYLELLRGSGTVSEEGTEEIDGRDTTHYAATIDYEELADSDDEGLRALAEQSLRFSAIDTVPVEVWVDGEGLIRRQRIQLETKELNGTPGQKQDITIELGEYGVPLTGIEAPPEGDVYDGTDAAAEALG